MKWMKIGIGMWLSKNEDENESRAILCLLQKVYFQNGFPNVEISTKMGIRLDNYLVTI